MMTDKQLHRQNIIVIVILVFLIACGLGIHSYFNYSLRPVNSSSERIVHVKIPQGATDHQVGKILKEKQLVRSSFVCDYYLQTHKKAGVKAGTFKLKASYSTPQIVSILQEPQKSR
jgi:UPF0755 protein